MAITIKNVTIVTMNPNHDILRGAQVRVKDGRIQAISVGKDLALPGDEVIDGSGQVVLPGLINAHCHAAMSIFRNYGNDVDLDTWLNDYIWPLEAQLTPEDIRKGSLLDIAEMISHGITYFVDMYYEMDKVAQAVEEGGIRALLTEGMTANDYRVCLDRQAGFFDRWDGKAEGRIRTGLSTHAVYTNTEESMEAAVALGKELGACHHIHLSETKKEVEDCRARFGMSPVEVFDKMGYLNDRTIAAHCVWLSERDMDILADRGVHPVYNPASNMKLASGFMPLEGLLSRGIPVAMGTDGAASNNSQDLFRDMTIGSLIQKGRSLDPTAARARTMLEMATINGARALGQEEDLGSIEVGKMADLIMVDFRGVGMTPIPDDIEAALVYSTSGRDVSLTMVAGKILYRDYRFTELDEKRIKADCQDTLRLLRERRAHDGSGH